MTKKVKAPFKDQIKTVPADEMLAKVSGLLMASAEDQELDTGEALNLLREAHDTIDKLAEYLWESHVQAVEDEDGGFRVHDQTEPDCSYCAVLGAKR